MVRTNEQLSFLRPSIDDSSALASGSGLIEEREDPRGGTLDTDDTMNARIWKIFGLADTIDSRVLEDAIRVGLGYFPLSGNGRICSPKRATRLLRRIENTGFPLDSHDNLDDRELWVYVLDTKEALRMLGDYRCPHVLKDVDAEHAEAYLNH